jgi:hypothetical protein
MRAIRVLLILLIAVVGVLVFAHLSGRMLINDHRLAHAVASYASDPTDTTRQEMAEATVAAHRRRALELLEVAGVLLLLFGGVTYSTRVIRAQTV